MNLTLIRKECIEEGIFSELHDESGCQIAVTLEHSYDCKPKIPNGVYTCKRGPHRLHSMTQDFETFEITGVEGHSNILFHRGNCQADSEGCVLLGMSRLGDLVLSSHEAFAKFMALQAGIDTFQLTVTDLH